MATVIRKQTTKKSRGYYKIPRVVPNQKERFYKEDIFRMHSKYIEVKNIS